MGVRSVEEIRGCIQALMDGTGEYVLVEVREQTLDVVLEHQENFNDGDSVTVFLDEMGAVVRDIPVMKNMLIHSLNGLIRGY